MPEVRWTNYHAGYRNSIASEDDEAWFGQHNGFLFGLAYERTKTPGDALADYARDVLNNSEWLSSTLSEAKQKAKRSFYGRNQGEAEIEGLSFGRILFYVHKGRRRIIADLEGGNNDRLWRIQYSDKDCEGIGFDS